MFIWILPWSFMSCWGLLFHVFPWILPWPFKSHCFMCLMHKLPISWKAGNMSEFVSIAWVFASAQLTLCGDCLPGHTFYCSVGQCVPSVLPSAQCFSMLLHFISLIQSLHLLSLIRLGFVHLANLWRLVATMLGVKLNIVLMELDS